MYKFFLLLLMSCSAESHMTSETRSGQANIVAEPATPASADNEQRIAEEIKVLEPIAVGGAFLSCSIEDDVRCRLDTVTMEKIDVSDDAEVKFQTGETLIDHSDLGETEGYSWLLDPVMLEDELTLTLSRGDEVKTYKMLVQSVPLHIGDGTSRAQGCTVNQTRDAESVGNVYNRNFPITEPGTYSIALSQVCGVLRPNDTEIRLRSPENEQIHFSYIPRTDAPIDIDVEFEAKTAGDYRFSIKVGDNRDIDDLYVNSLILVKIK